MGMLVAHHTDVINRFAALQENSGQTRVNNHIESQHIWNPKGNGVLLLFMIYLATKESVESTRK